MFLIKFLFEEFMKLDMWIQVGVTILVYTVVFILWKVDWFNDNKKDA